MVQKQLLYPGVIILMAGVLAACRPAAGNEPPTPPETPDAVSAAVQQTVDAISVAETVEALTGGQAEESDPTAVPDTPVPPAEEPPTEIPPTTAPEEPTEVPPTEIPPTAIPPTAELPTAVPPTAVPPTAAPPTAEPTAVVAQPPDVSNNVPGGACERTANIEADIWEDPFFLYRVVARDNRVGQHDGNGIRQVRFSITGHGVDYYREENVAGYCIFGGGEPDCHPWPQNEHGQFIWGEGGPVVENGDYHARFEVVSETRDSDTQDDVCNWDFDLTVTLR